MRIRLTGDYGTVEIESDQRVPTGLISPHPTTESLIEGAIKLYKALEEKK